MILVFVAVEAAARTAAAAVVVVVAAAAAAVVVTAVAAAAAAAVIAVVVAVVEVDVVKCLQNIQFLTKRLLSPGQYVANQCQGHAHCIPCEVRFPSCKGLPDGLNPWLGREMSPYYVLCNAERALYQGMCDNSQGTQLFDPEKRLCSAIDVRGDEGGMTRL